MENNKLLIGIQFTYKDENEKIRHNVIELYVVRDITLYQLMDGIDVGLSKLGKGDKYSDIYLKCREVFKKCLANKEKSKHLELEYFPNITLTSFSQTAINDDIGKGASNQHVIYLVDWYKPLCDLGFVSSSRLVFDETGSLPTLGKLDTANVIEAFDPDQNGKVCFPEYNISTRQLWKFNDSPINIIPPSDPPKKQNYSLFTMLLPSLITVGVLMIVRYFFMSGGLAMMVLSASMGLTAAVTTVLTWKRQKKEYAQNLAAWREQYQNYINNILTKIKERQDSDIAKLHELYPDMLSLVKRGKNGIYALNENIYSRAPQDEDFLSFRIGVSDCVKSKFEIKGEDKDVVFSEANYELCKDKNGKAHIKLYLRNELKENQEKPNLSHLPADISERYRYLKNAPLLYSLKRKSALGIVDYHVDNPTSRAQYFISRMIFELCYYHSPENLQFVVFFNSETEWDSIENCINQYRFMPHFRGLFSDKSQFVFDKDSASSVLSSLLGIIGKRKATDENSSDGSLPHIVFIVFEEHGLKEHAFAEYLPHVPEREEDMVNSLGLTFVFAMKYKEYLPSYCDDIVEFVGDRMTITPHFGVSDRAEFKYPIYESQENSISFTIQNTIDLIDAYRFFAAIHYAQIAQNGKVPSTVRFFELLGDFKDNLTERIIQNWGFGKKETTFDVTKSLKVPIGKTENGMAYLDLHEKADGPHMLVAGTTGSGKTETVISYLLGLCIHYRPDELNLLLVDMKGGGFTKRIGCLPHVVGCVTDVDGDENGTGAEYMLRRFLFAVKAEIKRRKILLNKLHVDSIDAYIKACRRIDSHIEEKKVSPEEAEIIRETAKNSPLSHIILIVDEFTELKRFSSENNDVDFITEITTIARVGRSLGFHIILISQNIEGAITEDIRVNTNARLCLKVATKQASKDMIGTELAASSSMPGNGRAYLLVGTGSKFEYFQSGYSGAGVKEEIPVEIVQASKYGAYRSFYRSDRDGNKVEGSYTRTQLDATVEAISSAYNSEKERLGVPHIVFRAPLPTHIALLHKKSIVDLVKNKTLMAYKKEKDDYYEVSNGNI